MSDDATRSRVRCSYCLALPPERHARTCPHATPDRAAVDPVVEEVAKYLHSMLHTSPYERWSCWINAEDVVNIVRKADRV